MDSRVCCGERPACVRPRYDSAPSSPAPPVPEDHQEITALRTTTRALRRPEASRGTPLPTPRAAGLPGIEGGQGEEGDLPQSRGDASQDHAWGRTSTTVASLAFPRQSRSPQASGHSLLCISSAQRGWKQMLRQPGGAPDLQQNRPLPHRSSHRERYLHPPTHQTRSKNSTWMPPPLPSRSLGSSARLRLHLTHPLPATSSTTYPK